MINFKFLGNGALTDDYLAWYRYAKVIDNSGVPGTYVTELKVKDATTKVVIGYYRITVTKQADENVFSVIKIEDINKSETRQLKSAVYGNELWINVDKNAFMEYALISGSCVNLETFELSKPASKNEPKVKAILNGGITLSNLDPDEFAPNNDIPFFNGMPVENFLYGDNFKGSSAVESLEDIVKTGSYGIKDQDGEFKKLVQAIASPAPGKDDMLFIILDVDTKEVKIKKRIDGIIVEDTLNDIVLQWNGTQLEVSNDGGKTFIPKELRGPEGLPGKTPGHKWVGTTLAFVREDGKMGEFVDLRGPIPRAQISADKTSVKFEQDGGWTEWMTIKGDKGDIPKHRYVDKDNNVIEDPESTSVAGNGVFLQFQRPEGGWSEHKITLVGLRAQHRYLMEDGVTPTTNSEDIFYIQFENKDGSWGIKAKVIGRDGSIGLTPKIIRYDKDMEKTNDPDLTMFVAFEEQAEGEPIKEGPAFGVRGIQGERGISPAASFSPEGKLVIDYGEGEQVVSPTLIPQAFPNGTKIKFLMGYDGESNPIYTPEMDLVGPVPAHEYNEITKKIRFVTPTGWGEWLDFIGPQGIQGFKGDLIDHKFENGVLLLERSMNGEKQWGDPIDLNIRFDKKIENEIVSVKFYNELIGLDSDWIPVTTITVPTDLKPLLHVMNAADMYPGTTMPDGYVERAGQTIDLSDKPVLKAILIKHGLVAGDAVEWTVDNTPGSYVKVEYREEIVDMLMPEGHVAAYSSPDVKPWESPLLSSYNWQKTDLLAPGMELEDFIPYKRLETSLTVPKLLTSDVQHETASFTFEHAETTFELQTEAGAPVVAQQTGKTASFSDLRPNTNYQLVFMVRDNADAEFASRTHPFTTIRANYLEVPQNLRMTAQTANELTIEADAIEVYGLTVNAEITCVETTETLTSPASFMGLLPGASYTFRARYPENSTNNVSGYCQTFTVSTLKNERLEVPNIAGDPSTAVTSSDADTLTLDLAISTEDGEKVTFEVDVDGSIVKGKGPLTINGLTPSTAYNVIAYYGESATYYANAEEDKITFSVSTKGKKADQTAPTNVSVEIFAAHIIVDADPYIMSDGTELKAKVSITETGQALDADGTLRALTGVTGVGGETITAQIYYGENAEITQSAIHTENLVTVALQSRVAPMMAVDTLATDEISVSIPNSTEDNLAATIECVETAESSTSPASFINLTAGATYTIKAKYAATHEFAETIITEEIATLKLDRSETPIMYIDQITADTILVASPDSTEDNATAEITCAETGETFSSPARFTGLTNGSTYTFTAKYPVAEMYKEGADSDASTKTIDGIASIERPLGYNAEKRDNHLLSIPEEWKGKEIRIEYEVKNDGSTVSTGLGYYGINGEGTFHDGSFLNVRHEPADALDWISASTTLTLPADWVVDHGGWSGITESNNNASLLIFAMNNGFDESTDGWLFRNIKAIKLN